MAEALTINLSQELYRKFLLFLKHPVELPEFGDYARRKYPKVDEGLITLIETLILGGNGDWAGTPPVGVLLMKGLRDQGHSLQVIADRLGVCKQRVSQLLKRHYGSTEVPMLSRLELAKRFGCSPTSIGNLEVKGKLKPVHFEGESHHYYPEQEVGKISRLLARRCSICGEPIPYSRHRYCADCAGEVKREYHRKYWARKKLGISAGGP